MLAELTTTSRQQAMLAAVGEADGLRDGLVLLKVWLRQRQLNVVSEALVNWRFAWVRRWLMVIVIEEIMSVVSKKEMCCVEVINSM